MTLSILLSPMKRPDGQALPQPYLPEDPADPRSAKGHFLSKLGASWEGHRRVGRGKGGGGRAWGFRKV